MHASGTFLGWITFIFHHLRLEQIVQRERGEHRKGGEGKGGERRGEKKEQKKSELGVEHFIPLFP